MEGLKERTKKYAEASMLVAKCCCLNELRRLGCDPGTIPNGDRVVSEVLMEEVQSISGKAAVMLAFIFDDKHELEEQETMVAFCTQYVAAGIKAANRVNARRLAELN